MGFADFICMKLFALVFLLFLLTCQAERKNDPFLESLQNIDQGQYTEAIDKLEILHSKDPSPAVTMALASAYAGRAGIETLGFLDFAEGLQGDPLSQAKLEELDSYKKNHDAASTLYLLLPAETQQRLT